MRSSSRSEVGSKAADATEQQAPPSIFGPESNLISDTRNWLWKRNRHHCSVFSQAQCHGAGAVFTKPEVLHTNELGRASCGQSLQAKETAFFEIVKRGGTRRIAALGDHTLAMPLCQTAWLLCLDKEHANKLPSQSFVLPGLGPANFANCLAGGKGLDTSPSTLAPAPAQVRHHRMCDMPVAEVRKQFASAHCCRFLSVRNRIQTQPETRFRLY